MVKSAFLTATIRFIAVLFCSLANVVRLFSDQLIPARINRDCSFGGFQPGRMGQAQRAHHTQWIDGPAALGPSYVLVFWTGERSAHFFRMGARNALAMKME